MAVESFQGENRYLSNMYVLPDGLYLGPDKPLVPTTENPYQAEKFVRPAAREAVLHAKNGYAAKRLAHQLEDAGEPVRADWGERKLELMQDLVSRKFAQYPELAERLLATGDEPIEEGNTWDDTYWGISPAGSGIGMNYLGHILMDTRAALRLEAKNRRPGHSRPYPGDFTHVAKHVLNQYDPHMLTSHLDTNEGTLDAAPDHQAYHYSRHPVNPKGSGPSIPAADAQQQTNS